MQGMESGEEGRLSLDMTVISLSVHDELFVSLQCQLLLPCTLESSSGSEEMQMYEKVHVGYYVKKRSPDVIDLRRRS